MKQADKPRPARSARTGRARPSPLSLRHVDTQSANLSTRKKTQSDGRRNGTTARQLHAPPCNDDGQTSPDAADGMTKKTELRYGNG
jgi:hypothetical protein